MDRIAAPLTPSLDSESHRSQPVASRGSLGRFVRPALLLVSALSLLALSGCADQVYDPRTGTYHSVGDSQPYPPRAYYHDYSDVPGYRGDQPPPPEDRGYVQGGYDPADAPPPPDGDAEYSYVEAGPPPDIEPYYLYSGIPYFFIGGRYCYYRNNHRYYVTHLPHGGSYYHGHGGGGYSHSDYHQYSGGYHRDDRHDYHGDHQDYHGDHHDDRHDHHDNHQQQRNGPSSTADFQNHHYSPQNQNNPQNGKNNSRDKKKDHQN